MAKNPTVVFVEPKKAVIEDRPIPKPDEGQVLVKARRTLISTGTELTIFKGEFPKDGGWAAWAKFPFTPGYSNIGDVIEVKDRAKQLALVLEAIKSAERDVPDYVNADHNKMTASLTRIPALADVPYPVRMEPNLVVEFYSR